MKKQWLIYLGVFVLGVMTAPKVKTLPLLDKLPTL